ncbi:hypothetical protein QQ045_001499 [Rhodiola kirilowii]
MEGSNASVERCSDGERAMEDKRQGSSVELSSSNSDGDRVSRIGVRSVTSKDAQLESTKAEMGEVREENERLRMHLDKMIKDYQALKNQFQAATRRENHKLIIPSTNQTTTVTTDTITSDSHRELEEEEENDLVLLSLGRTSSIDLNISKVSQGNEKDGLDLGLGDYKLLEGSKSDALVPADEVLPLPGLENISSSAEDAAKEESAAEGSSCPSRKDLKRREEDNNGPSHPASNGKRARVCLRIRCETPTMNDGCQWRKYGQKIAKGNPCPRAYYRCTVAPACPVRKQVQRCAEDMSILIITYEGTHNHPLPISATGMASTTSAAASMLLSGPSSTLTNPNTSRPSSTGLSFYAPNPISNKHNFQQQYQLPSSSSSSPNPNHQTITLDLTSSNYSSTPSHNPQFNPFPRSSSASFPIQYSSRPTSLNFASSSPNSLHGNPSNNMFSYSSFQANTTSNNNQFSSSTLDPNTFYQSTAQRSNNTDTMTAAITADPSFQSALAEALTTIIGGRDGQLQGMISGLQPGGLNNSSGLGLSSSGSRSAMPNSFSAATKAAQRGAALAKSTSTSPSGNIKEHSN